MKAATTRHFGDRGHQPWNACQRAASVRVAGDQLLSIGVHWMVEDLTGRPSFDRLTRIHDGDAFAEFGHNAEIMGYKQNRRLQFAGALFRRARIWRCAVTSSAEVGSSATMIWGWQTRAPAIIKR